MLFPSLPSTSYSSPHTHKLHTHQPADMPWESIKSVLVELALSGEREAGKFAWRILTG